jgi:hypothetical protein
MLPARNDLARQIVQIPYAGRHRRNKCKLRREFRQKGYRAVYHEVSGYPPKRELAHEWLREQERASDRRKRWTFTLTIVLATVAAVVAAYLAAVQLKWL